MGFNSAFKGLISIIILGPFGGNPGKLYYKSRVRPMSLCVGYAKAVTLSYQLMALARLRHAWEPGKQFDKMAVPLQQCTKQEQRSVVRFMFSEGVKHIEIHRRNTETVV